MKNKNKSSSKKRNHRKRNVKKKEDTPTVDVNHEYAEAPLEYIIKCLDNRQATDSDDEDSKKLDSVRNIVRSIYLNGGTENMDLDDEEIQELVDDVCKNNPIRLFFALEKETLDFFLNIQQHLNAKLDFKSLNKRMILKNINKFLNIWNMILKCTKKLNGMFENLTTKLKDINSNDNVSYKKINYVLLSEIILEDKIGRYISFVLKEIKLPVPEDFRKKIDALYKTIHKLKAARKIWKDDLIRFHISGDSEMDSLEDCYSESDLKDDISRYSSTDESEDTSSQITDEGQSFSSKNTLDIQELVKLLGKNVSHNVSLKELQSETVSLDGLIPYKDEHVDMDTLSDSESSGSEIRNPESFHYTNTTRNHKHSDIYEEFPDFLEDDLPNESDEESEDYSAIKEKRALYKHLQQKNYPGLFNIFNKNTRPAEETRSVDDLVKFIEGEDSKKKSKKKKKKKKKTTKTNEETHSETPVPTTTESEAVLQNPLNYKVKDTSNESQTVTLSPSSTTIEHLNGQTNKETLPSSVKEKTEPLVKPMKDHPIKKPELHDIPPSKPKTPRKISLEDKKGDSVKSNDKPPGPEAPSDLYFTPSEEDEELETILKICELRTTPQMSKPTVKNNQHLENVAKWALQDDRNKFKGR